MRVESIEVALNNVALSRSVFAGEIFGGGDHGVDGVVELFICCVWHLWSGEDDVTRFFAFAVVVCQ